LKNKVLAFTLFALLAASTASAKGQTVVLASTGKVEYRESASSEWKPIGGRVVLKEGSMIVTGPESFCEIGFVEGSQSVVRVAADSLAVIVSVDPARIDLQNGRLFSLVKNLRKSSSFSVSTPTAVASVRGTGWEQTAERITVFDDAVRVEGKNGETANIGEGTGVPIGRDGDLGELFPVSAQALLDWNAFKETASARLGEHLNEVLTDIQETDPTEDLFENKNAFEESVEQAMLDSKLRDTNEDDSGGDNQT
jgi:hypothetical protein